MISPHTLSSVLPLAAISACSSASRRASSAASCSARRAAAASAFAFRALFGAGCPAAHMPIPTANRP